MHRAARLTLVVLCIVARAHGNGLDLTGIGPRATAHAGAAVASVDDFSAAYYNPAGLARRSELRAQAGLSLSTRALTFASAIDFSARQAESVRNEAPPDLLPWGGLALGVGRSLVVGIAYVAPSVISYELATAPDYDQPLPDEEHRYPQRYAASRFVLDRRGLGLGIGVRPLPWLALGIAAFAYDVSLVEDRTIWGGEPSSDPLYAPRFDMSLSATGRDRFVPTATLGFLVAPSSVPVEIGGSVSWSDSARLTGPVSLRDTRGVTGEPPQRYATANVDSGARARIQLPIPVTLRTGLRYLGRRFVVEAEVDLEFGAATAVSELSWAIDGVTVIRREGTKAAIGSVPLGAAIEDRGALRLAADVDLVPGFLTINAGYAFARGWVPRRFLSSALPDLDTLTLALGLEARVSGGGVSFGLARSFGVATDVTQAETGIQWVAPFTTEPIPVGGGRYDGAETLVSVGVEVELP